MAIPRDNQIVDDDWEEIEDSKPEDTFSIVSDDETVNDQEYERIEHPKETQYRGRIYQHPEEAPKGPLPSLRKALYALKDVLRDSVDQLGDLSLGKDETARRAIAEVKDVQQQQVNALNTLLTNDAANWEASAQSGGMTFDEFAELDPAAIQRFQKAVDAFTDEVRLRKYDTPEKLDIRRSGEDRRQAVKQLDTGFLDEIQVLSTELNAFLRIPQGDQALSAQPAMEPLDESKIEHALEQTLIQNDKVTALQEQIDHRVHKGMHFVSDW